MHSTVMATKFERSTSREHNDKMRIATLNVGTLKDRTNKLVEAMENYELDILCLQETRKASSGNETISDRYKVYYSGGDGQKNGVAVCVKKNWKSSIKRIKLDSDFFDRIIAIELQIQNRIFNIFSVYAPQEGKLKKEVTDFWKELTEITDSIPLDEELIVAGDFNGHVGTDREGFDMWHGGYSTGKRNTPGKIILEFARDQNLVLVNTFFTKKPTYESGGDQTVVDYLTIRRDSRVIIGNCKVIPVPYLASEHNLVLMDLTLEWKNNIINWWKLNTLKGDKLLPKLRVLLEEENENSWSETYKAIICKARKILGETEQGNCLNNQSWWWDDYKREICLNDEQWWIIATIASQKKIISSNFSVSPFNNSDVVQAIKRTWKDHFDELLNPDRNSEIPQQEGNHAEIEAITESEVKEQINSMEFTKERDLNHIPIMLVNMLGDKGITWLLSYLHDAIKNKEIPDVLKQTKITLKLKKNRDPFERNNYYGICSSSDFLALLEGILKKRLQEITNIKEKSTTESVFCIRMFQERQREFKKELHMILIKLGNACHTTPSEGVWNCLRRKEVPESYISFIKRMYSDYQARVVTGVGETEEFRINLPLHRGSVLSNQILAIVLNVIIEKFQEEFPDEEKWEFPWTMVHGDCIVLSDVRYLTLRNRLRQFEKKLKDVVGLNLHQMEIEYISPTSLEDSIQLQNGITIESCASFKFVQTTIQKEGGCKKEVERKISKAWRKWHQIKGLLCDEKFPLRMKTIIYEKVIRRALLYDCETWPISEKERENIDKCEMRMLRHCLDEAKEETDDSIRKTLNITAVQTVMRERRLLWYGKVIRNELSEEVGKIVEWEVQNGNRGQGRPKLRWKDIIDKDMGYLGVTHDDATNK